MLGDAMRRDAMRCDVMRCSGWKEDAGGKGRRLSKDDCWVPEGNERGLELCALGLGRGRDGGDGGVMTSEVNRKRKSSGYVATGWDGIDLHDSFPRACLFLLS